jgi:PAS domain S-box-containing protein
MTTHEILPWQHQAEHEVGFAMDRFGNISQMGSGWNMLTGESAQDVLCSPFADIIHPADRPPVLEALQSLIRGEIYSCRMPARCLRRDGLHCWVEVYAHPSLDADGRIDGVRGSFTDITDRRKGMRALRESEARFRAISDASPLGVYVTDAGGGCIFANANFEQISGLRADQARAAGHLSTLHPEDRARVLQARGAATCSRTPYGVDCRYVHADGTVAWTRINGAPIRDGGSLLGFVHVVEDVTAQRSAGETLRRSQERLRLALEGSGDVLLDWDLRSGEVYLSEQWGQLVGGPQGAAVTTVRDLLELVHPREQPLVQQAVDETLSGERPFLRVQYRVRTQAGEWKWVETHARVMERSADGTPLRVTGTSADITDRKNLEARQAEFIATVSHELRTPLASLIGFIETLRGPAKDDAEARERFLGLMSDQAGRMGRLVQDLLSLSAIELAEHTRPGDRVGLAATFGSVVAGLEMEARAKDMTIERDLAPDLPPVLGNGDQIAQLLSNLIGNAIKYGRAGTPVTVSAHFSAEVPQDMAAAVEQAGGPGVVRIEVRDRGEGIDAEHIPRLTERFYRVDTARSRAVGGTGLGLAIVKHIVARHRGLLEIESEVGEGSTFSVTLPAAPRDGAAG